MQCSSPKVIKATKARLAPEADRQFTAGTRSTPQRDSGYDTGSDEPPDVFSTKNDNEACGPSAGSEGSRPVAAPVIDHAPTLSEVNRFRD